MSVTNPISALAAIGYTIYSGVQEDKKTEAYFEGFAPTLADYDIDGGGENDPCMIRNMTPAYREASGCNWRGSQPTNNAWVTLTVMLSCILIRVAY